MNKKDLHLRHAAVLDALPGYIEKHGPAYYTARPPAGSGKETLKATLLEELMEIVTPFHHVNKTLDSIVARTRGSGDGPVVSWSTGDDTIRVVLKSVDTSPFIARMMGQETASSPEKAYMAQRALSLFAQTTGERAAVDKLDIALLQLAALPSVSTPFANAAARRAWNDQAVLLAGNTGAAVMGTQLLKHMTRDEVNTAVKASTGHNFNVV